MKTKVGSKLLLHVFYYQIIKYKKMHNISNIDTRQKIKNSRIPNILSLNGRAMF